MPTPPSTYGYACSHGNNDQPHDKLIDAQDAAHLGHDRDQHKAEQGDPQDRHGEGAGYHIPLAVTGAVGYGPGEEDQVGEGLDEEVPLEDQLEDPTPLAHQGRIRGGSQDRREARNEVDLILLLLLLLLIWGCAGHCTHRGRGGGVQDILFRDSLSVKVRNVCMVNGRPAAVGLGQEQ